MAAPKRVKKKEGEKLSPDNVEKVIALLEQANPITKKEACNRLNIAYNVARLNNIIEEHKYRKAQEAKFRAQKRGTPATPQEIKDVIESYLEGDSKQDIADRLYRSPTFVTNIVESVGVPQRGTGQNYVNFEPLPEQCISDKFEPGELVWSSRFQAVAEVLKERGLTSDGLSKLYQIYVLEKIEEPCPYAHGVNLTIGGFYANQPAYDLGRLKHLEEHGINVRKALKAPVTRQEKQLGEL